MFRALLGNRGAPADVKSQSTAYALQRKSALPLLNEDTSAPLHVEKAEVLSASKTRVPGTLIVTTERIIFAPKNVASARVILSRNKNLVIRNESGTLVCDGGSEGSAKFVFENAETASLLEEEINRGDKAARKPSDRQLDLCKAPHVGTIFLNIVRAKNLLAMDTTGKSDPFVRATLLFKEHGKEKFKEDAASTLQSQYVEQSLEPKWNAMMYWDVWDVMPSAVKVRVFDWDQLGNDDLIGHCVMPVTDSPKEPRDEWMLLSTDAGLNIGTAIKSAFAVTRKVGQATRAAAKEATNLAGVRTKSPRAMAKKEEVAPLEAGEPEIREGGVEQYCHMISSWKKATATPCVLIVGQKRVPGALVMLETRFIFLDEENQCLMNVTYDNVRTFEWVDKLVVLESTDSIFVFGEFQSKVNYQAMLSATQSKYGAPIPLKRKGAVERMPSILNLEGFDPLPTGAELTVSVIEGMKLIAKDKVNGQYTSSDPYVTVALLDPQQKPFAESVQETRVVYASLMPVWDQNFRFVVPPGAIAILLTVWDKDPGGIISNNDDFMGQVIISGKDVRNLLEATGQWEGWRKLEARGGRKERVSGKLRISLTMDPNALAEDEGNAPQFGIDMFNPTRRNSVTRLDFDFNNKFSTFKGTYRGQPCRVWVSDEGAAMYGHKSGVKLRTTWNHVVRIDEKKERQRGKAVLRGVELKGPYRSVYIHEPEAKGLRRLEVTFQRYKEAMMRTAPKPAGDPPSSMSFLRMHPWLTILVHGALTGKHTKTLILIWFLLSAYLWINLTYPGPFLPRVCISIAVGSILSWFVEHVEFGLDWPALIREQDFPLVEKDILDAQAGKNTTSATRVLAIIFGIVFMAAGSFPDMSSPTLAFPFVAALLVLVRTMLWFRQG